jgi:hypothetical protein
MSSERFVWAMSLLTHEADLTVRLLFPVYDTDSFRIKCLVVQPHDCTHGSLSRVKTKSVTDKSAVDVMQTDKLDRCWNVVSNATRTSRSYLILASMRSTGNVQ